MAERIKYRIPKATSSCKIGLWVHGQNGRDGEFKIKKIENNFNVEFLSEFGYWFFFGGVFVSGIYVSEVLISRGFCYAFVSVSPFSLFDILQKQNKTIGMCTRVRQAEIKYF